MKKIFAVVLACSMMLSLAACGSTGAKWTDEDLTFRDGAETVTVEVDHSFIVRNSGCYYTEYDPTDYSKYEAMEGLYETSRGLAVGMTLDDYKELYSVVKGYAVWEVFSGDENEYTSFEAYNNQDASELYDEYNNVWLDLGFKKVNGEWEIMSDVEVRDAWFCDADTSEFEEVVIFAVNLDEFNEIIGLSMEHFTYDENWAAWQDWA